MEDDPTPADAPTDQPSTQDAAPADPPPEPIVEDFHPTVAFRNADPPTRDNDRIRFKSPER